MFYGWRILCIIPAIALLASVIFVPNAEAATTKKVFICYWGSWSFYRTGHGRLVPGDMDPTLCTHLLYSFAGINPDTYRMQTEDIDLSHGPDDEPKGIQNMYRHTMALRNQNKDLKILLAVGGANAPKELFSAMASTPENRASFIQGAMDLLINYRFDGLDLDWEYPEAHDKENFVSLVRELKQNFTTRGLILTTAVVVNLGHIDAGYDVRRISQWVDYINIMAYDFKGFNTEIGHQSPLFGKESEGEADRNLTVSAAVEHYLFLGAPPEKLVLGVPAYGRTYTLKSFEEHNFYDEAKGPGPPFQFSNTTGVIQYNEICLNLVGNNSWTFNFDHEYYVPYVYNDQYWIGYDDEYSIIRKVDYAEEKNLGGMMIWSLEMDDFRNLCGAWMSWTVSYTVKERMSHHERRNAVSR